MLLLLDGVVTLLRPVKAPRVGTRREIPLDLRFLLDPRRTQFFRRIESSGRRLDVGRHIRQLTDQALQTVVLRPIGGQFVLTALVATGAEITETAFEVFDQCGDGHDWFLIERRASAYPS